MGKHLQEYERYLIERWLKEHCTVTEIARRLNRNHSVILYEIKKGTVVQLDHLLKEHYVYCADYAQRVTHERGKKKGAKTILAKNQKLTKLIEHLIVNEHYSPYACVQVIKQSDFLDCSLCETTLYKYIDRGYIRNVSNKNLPIKGNRKQTHHKIKSSRPSHHNKNGKMIEQRPEEINNRDSYGHWEMDTVYSGKKKSKKCLLVLTERQTLDEYVFGMKDRTSESTIETLDKLERSLGADLFRERFKTITCDNGVEFSVPELIERSALSDLPRTEVYYCHPYCSSERPQNENQNKLIRRWIKKGESIGAYSEDFIQYIQDWMNDYPRRKFGGLSVNEYKQSLGL